MHGFTNVARSISPILSGYQRPSTPPKRRVNSFSTPTPSTPVRPRSPKVNPGSGNPFQISPSIPPIPIRYNFLFQNALLPEELFCSDTKAWSEFDD